jgi:hypothetical protein
MNTALIGASDKTNLQLELLHNDLPDGLILLDFDGSLAEAFANSIPVSETERVVYLDPSDIQHPFGLNVLEMNFDVLFPAGKTTLTADYAETILETTLHVLQNVPDATLLYVFKFLSDTSFRQNCLSRCTDPVVLDYWAAIETDPKQYQGAIALLHSRMTKLLRPTLIRNIVGQVENTFRFDGVVIANLDRSKVGDRAATFLGHLLLTRATGKVYINNLGSLHPNTWRPCSHAEASPSPSASLRS